MDYLTEIDHVKVAEVNPGIAIIAREDNSRNIASERRRDVRHKCEGTAEFYAEGIDVRTRAAVSDISRSGCYVEMQATSPVNTLVDLLITVNGIGVRVKGVVRTSYPLLGMGIAFTEISKEAQVQLEELILLCAVRTSPPASETNTGQSLPAVPGLLMIMDAGAALNALASFFQNNQTLTREEFSLLVSKSQNHDAGSQL
jgi:PilZ domain